MENIEKKNADPLKVIQDGETPVTLPISEVSVDEKNKRPKFELPEGYLLAKEMKELFEEDIVTHVQGGSEPEGD
ncbi:MAG: hypothetical protein AAB317_04435 [Nitrospirota bacterium]